MSFDVIVIGLGVIGSACAAELSRRGARVLGVERFERGHSRGSSHGGSRLFREFHPGRPALAPLAREAMTGWQRLAHEAGLALFHETGGLLVGASDDPGWTAAIAAATEAGVRHDQMDDRALRELVPSARHPSGSLGFYEPGAGVLFAERCVGALQDRALAAGATLRFEVVARLATPGARDRDRPIAIRLGDERVTADRVVFASGPWTAALELVGGAPRLTVERAVIHWVDADPIDARGSSAPFLCFLRDEFGIFPWLPGQGTKYGRFHTGEMVDADGVDRVVRPQEWARDTALLNRYLGANVSRPTRSAVCLYTHTPDGSFAIGHVGPRVLMLSPCSGMGFKFAPAIARIAADALLGDDGDDGDGGGGGIPVARWW